MLQSQNDSALKTPALAKIRLTALLPASLQHLLGWTSSYQLITSHSSVPWTKAQSEPSASLLMMLNREKWLTRGQAVLPCQGGMLSGREPHEIQQGQVQSPVPR